MCPAKILSLVKKKILDIRGQPGSILFLACDLKLFHSFVFWLGIQKNRCIFFLWIHGLTAAIFATVRKLILG